MIRLFDHLQRVPLVAFLAAAMTTALAAQIARSRLLQTITARRLATVAAVLGQLIAQRLDDSSLFIRQLLQLLHLLLQRQDDRYEVFNIQLLELATLKVKLFYHHGYKYTTEMVDQY